MPKQLRKHWSKPRGVSRQGYRRQCRRRFERIPVSGVVAEASAIYARGVNRIPRSEAAAFLLKNHKIAERAMVGIGMDARLAHECVFSLSKLSPDIVSSVLKQTVLSILGGEISALNSGKLDGHILRYFRERGIPVGARTEREAFSAAVRDFFRDRKITASDFSRPLDLAGIEERYLQTRRDFKGLGQLQAEERNFLFAEIFGRERLTPNQKREARRWIGRNFDAIEKEHVAAMRAVTERFGGALSDDFYMAYLEEKGEVNARFLERARKELLPGFRQSGAKSAAAPAAARAAAPAKPGTREERLAAYRPNGRNRAEKVLQISRESRRAELQGRPFDQVSYMLGEIRGENARAAEVISGLLHKGLLHGASVTPLFVSGSPAQRIFVAAVESQDFRRRFGGKQADLLARGISYIGPGGKRIARAKRVFQGETGKSMFDFLERKGLLETSHGGGKVVYLARI